MLLTVTTEALTCDRFPQDAYEFELLSFLSKEVDISDIFKEHFQLQLEYHRNMLSKLQEYVPKFEGIFGKCVTRSVPFQLTSSYFMQSTSARSPCLVWRSRSTCV